MRHAASPSGPFLLGSPLPAFGLRLFLSARPLIPAVAGQQGISSHRSSTRVAPGQGNQLWASAARSLCQRSEGFPGRRGCEPLRRRRERRMVLERSKPTWLMLKRNRFFFFFSLLNSFVGGRRLRGATAKYRLSQTEIFFSTYTGKRLNWLRDI